MNGGMYGSQPMGMQRYGQQLGQQYGQQGWSNPYWRPQPAQQTQVPQQAQTGIGGRPISQPPPIVNQYIAAQQAMAALAQQQTAANQANMQQGYQDSYGGV